MDSGLTIRPTASVAETVYVRPETPPVRAAVPTMLAASRTVSASSESGRAAGYDPAHDTVPQQRAAGSLSQQQDTTRVVLLDPQSREVIYRVIDVRTGQVDRQIPDAALLRLRAYNRALLKGESSLQAESGTDRAV